MHLYIKYKSLLILIPILVFCANPLWAQKRMKVTEYSGSIPVKTIKKNKKVVDRIRKKSTNYSGAIPNKALNKNKRVVGRITKKRNNYSGTIKLKDLNRIKRSVARTSRRRHNYSGTIRISDLNRIRRKARKNDKKRAQYCGFIRVQKRPKKSTTRIKPIKYFKKPYSNWRRNIKGLSRMPFFGVKKDDIPRWQKEKPPKPKVDKKEHEIWSQTREVPIPDPPPKEKKRKKNKDAEPVDDITDEK